MGIEGQITVTLHTAAGRVAAVDVASTRPLHAPRVFVGRSPREVLETLPMIYSLCATAQTAAARRALMAALAMPAGPVDAAMTVLVEVETVREHGLGILLGWAEYLGEPPADAAPRLVRLVPAVRAALFAADGSVAVDRAALTVLLGDLDALLREQVFGIPPAAWLEMDDPEQLARWAARSATVAARVVAAALATKAARRAPETTLLPELDDGYLRSRLAGADGDAFIARPHWHGAPAETSSLSRQAARPLVAALRRARGDDLATRLAARLVELAAVAARLREVLAALGEGGSPRWADAGAADGEGIGQAEAARGRLVHRVELAAGRVTRYQVLAPTEWNFHPGGAAMMSLRGMAAGDEEELRRRAALAIRAVDPCVGFAIEVA